MPAKDPRRDFIIAISRRNNDDGPEAETRRAPATKSTDDDDDGLASVYGEWQREARRRIRATKRLVTSLGTAAALYVIARTI